MNPSDAVLQRVRKLLALATSPNVHEAAAAAARAQALISEHRLADLLNAERSTEPIVDDRENPVYAARRLRKWRIALASELADANGCVVYTLDRGADKAVIAVGRQADLDALRTLFDGLAPQIEWLSATHSPGASRQWHDSFRLGAVAHIAQRLRQTPTTTDTAALAVIQPAMAAHRAAVHAFVSERLSLKPGRRVMVIGPAYDSGLRAASELVAPDLASDEP